MQRARIDIYDLLRKPAVHLVGGLALAAGLLLLPTRCTEALKARGDSLLKPGQLGVLALREHGKRILGGISSHFDTVDKLAKTRRELEQLSKENRRLSARLAVAESCGVSGMADSQATGITDPGTTDTPCQDAKGRERTATGNEASSVPLLSARWISARVLGQQARTFLDRRHLLDLGSQSAIETEALVIEAASGLIDLGRDAELEPGQVVRSGARVWGKIIQVGPHTSTVRTVTEPGYRDVVQLADIESGAGRVRWGPQGILEGTGERLARIRLVEVTEPVSVGDLVYSAAAKGILPEPPLYGRIVRVERPVGAAHWEIWMEPAVTSTAPEAVAVLRAELNPLRVAKAP